MWTLPLVSYSLIDLIRDEIGSINTDVNAWYIIRLITNELYHVWAHRKKFSHSIHCRRMVLFFVDKKMSRFLFLLYGAW